jgi:hypothetical protein
MAPQLKVSPKREETAISVGTVLTTIYDAVSLAGENLNTRVNQTRGSNTISIGIADTLGETAKQALETAGFTVEIE